MFGAERGLTRVYCLMDAISKSCELMSKTVHFIGARLLKEFWALHVDARGRRYRNRDTSSDITVKKNRKRSSNYRLIEATLILAIWRFCSRKLHSLLPTNILL